MLMPRPYYRGTCLLSAFLQDAAFSALCLGTLTAFSTSRVDSQDCFCIHAGILRLSLCKETYQRAGLQGQASTLSKGKFNIQVDFTTENFVKSKLLQRIKLSFETVFTAPFEVILSTENECLIPGFSQETCSTEKFTEMRAIPDWTKVMQAPDKSLNGGLDYEVFQEVQEDYLTHIALLSLPSTVPSVVDAYISTYTCPNTAGTQSIETWNITGFIDVQYTTELLQQLSQEAGTEAWFTLQIRGFEYTPMSWVGHEHGYLVGGENDVTILSAKNLTAPVDGDDPTDTKHHALVMWEVVGSRDAYN